MKRLINLGFSLFILGALCGCVSEPDEMESLSFSEQPANAQPDPLPQQTFQRGYSTTESETISALFSAHSKLPFLNEEPVQNAVSIAVGVDRDQRNDTSTRTTDNKVELRRRSSTGFNYQLTLTAFGRELTFTVPINSTARQIIVNLPDGNTSVYLWSVDDSWHNVLSGRGNFKYLVRFGASDYSTITQVNRRVYGVFGLATPDDMLPTTGSASYKGVFSGTGDRNGTFSQVAVDGDITLLADFAQGSVSGTLENLDFDNIRMRDVFTFDSAKITPEGFSGKVIAGPSNCVDCLTPNAASNVTGDFYGNAAQEVGGTFEISGVSSNSNTNVQMRGSFGAEKQ